MTEKDMEQNYRDEQAQRCGLAKRLASLPASDCSLSRWPTVEEVRANYLTEGTGWTYAVVTGFRDYGPVVAKFYITGGLVSDEEVFVDFPEGPALTPAGMLEWDEGQTLRFLCVANPNDNPHP